MNTTGNSSPFAACSVSRVTPSFSVIERVEVGDQRGIRQKIVQFEVFLVGDQTAQRGDVLHAFLSFVRCVSLISVRYRL